MSRQLNLYPNRPLIVVAMVAAAVAVTTAYLLACGPFLHDLETVRAVYPPYVAQYERGEVGVVRPRFARRYLVQAYRVFSGRSPLVVAASAPRPDPNVIRGFAYPSLFEQWSDLRDGVLGAKTSGMERIGTYMQFRYVGDSYQQILNCPDDAFASAIHTLAARKERFGASSPVVRDWTRAQAAVFANCPGPKEPKGDASLVLPEAPAQNADALVRADRAYQTAAAHFYGLDYEEAARRFRAIAADRNSPWRPYGQYLAARALIRLGTVRATNVAERDRYFVAAQDELKRVLEDRSAAALHESARGLIEFIAARMFAVERLHALSSVLASASGATEQDLDDYRWLMDRMIGDTVDYDYTSVGRRVEMVESDELSDWVLAVQGRGEPALDRAVERWRATHTPVWLVAAMWKLTPEHSAVNEVLEAARAIDRGSPTYATVAFLRVRLLADLGRRDEARALLATLPNSPEPGFQTETVNLLKAERLMLARNLDELLTYATRATTATYQVSARGADGQTRSDLREYAQPVFDEDAGAILTNRLPLDRLVDAATSPILPPRLRVRVAMAAFARAVLLRRDAASLRVAPVLAQLAPQLASDMGRYGKAATAEDRHLAAILLLMRTPGLHADVRGLDDEDSVETVEPGRTFTHLGGNWWCGFEERRFENRWEGTPELMNLLYPNNRVPYPEFISDAERSATEREFTALKAAGPARSYLAAEVLLWARAKPSDPDVAEALAAAVEGWRWGCGDNDKWELAQRAFATLQQRYPQSDWAQRTKYWYK